MYQDLIERLKQDPVNRDKFKKLFRETEVPTKKTLLCEGDISNNIYFIKKGCLRLWFNNDGKDITFQFFFENNAVSSIESFLEEKPSQFNLESIEPSKLVVLSRAGFEILGNHYPELKEGFFKLILNRMNNYANLFLSRIKDNPRKRYDELVKTHPEIIRRIPQHYIASYLGITPISLSRIRNKK